MTGKYLYAQKRKRIKKIPTYFFKILACSIILLPSYTLVLGPYELNIWKILFGMPQAFATSEKKKEDIYWEETTFCNSWEGLESLKYVEKK